jgi:hypothetical protein
MAELAAAAGMAVAFFPANWIMAPIFAKLVNEAIPFLIPGQSKKNLQKLVTHIIPQLKLTKKAAESLENKVLFAKLVEELRYAFYDLREVLDLVAYEHHENQLTKKRKYALIGITGPSNQVSSCYVLFAAKYVHNQLAVDIFCLFY